MTADQRADWHTPYKTSEDMNLTLPSHHKNIHLPRFDFVPYKYLVFNEYVFRTLKAWKSLNWKGKNCVENLND